MKQQFELVYYGKFTFTDTELMVTAERVFLHSHLADVKQKEYEAAKQANAGR